MKTLTKSIILILILVITNIFSFKLGSDSAKEHANTFTRLLVSVQNNIDILESAKKKDNVKIVDISKKAMLHDMQEMIASQMYNVLPISDYERSQAHALFKRIASTLNYDGVTLFNKNELSPPIGDFIIDNVNKNITIFGRL